MGNRRGAWPRLVPAASLPSAYAIDGAINELMFIAGPVLVSALMLVMPAQSVVTGAGASVLLVTVLPIASRAVRDAPPPEHSKDGNSQASRMARLAGPLTHRPTLVLLIIAAFGTFSFGCLRIATVASATAFGSASSAGLLQSALLAEHAPPHYRTEVFAWLNTFMWTGYGLGTAIAGALTGPGDNGATAFTTAAGVAFLGAALAAVFYRPAPNPSRPASLEAGRSA
ncbi:hypothetical protein [Nonomuraea sp. CA-141351]|uniref:hypothetical protein n=1 Tax=Nonomuraea sp. CA-141351 TaxID=3239996 RepID=UPI003D8BA658